MASTSCTASGTAAASRLFRSTFTQRSRRRSGSDGVVPIGVTADGREILTTSRSGGGSRVIAIARDGRSPPRPLFTTTRLVAAIEEAGGQYYIDQVDRSLEHLRVPISGGVPARLTTGLPTLNTAGALALPMAVFSMPPKSPAGRAV